MAGNPLFATKSMERLKREMEEDHNRLKRVGNFLLNEVRTLAR